MHPGEGGARGGATVDLEWKDGSLAAATITPSVSGPIDVRLGEKTVTLKAEAGRSVKLDGKLEP